jgi:hypothetical protein
MVTFLNILTSQLRMWGSGKKKRPHLGPQLIEIIWWAMGDSNAPAFGSGDPSHIFTYPYQSVLKQLE